MTERKDEQWLDEQLQRAVNEAKPVFDAEAWKRRHRKEYEALLSRRGQSSHSGVRLFFGRGAVGFAAAAGVVLVLGLLLSRPGRESQGPTVPTQPVARSSAGMMSMMSLRMAYEQGGFEALDRQLQDTLDEFGPRSSDVPLRGLF